MFDVLLLDRPRKMLTIRLLVKKFLNTILHSFEKLC